MHRYIPNTPEQRDAMLRAVGVRSTDDLFSDIPRELRLKDAMRLPPALSEAELSRLMKEQYGPAMQVFEGLKKSLDPNGIMNPYKLGV